MLKEVDEDPGPRSASLTVGDVMGPAIAVRQDTTLREVASVMVERHSRGVLVVDAQAHVVGMLTEQNLTLDAHYLRMACVKVPRLNGRFVTQLDEIDAACMAAKTMIAREVMERRITRAAIDEPLGAAVDRMQRHDAEHAVVCDENRVVGMLGREDLLRCVAGGAPIGHATPPSCVDGQVIRLNGKRPSGSVVEWLFGSWK